MTGYSFDPQAAKQVEKGLKDSIAELEEVGYFSVSAQQGRGFDSLSLSGMSMGDAGLADVFGQFCERWGWAVREKIQDANEMAAGLGLSAGMYHEQEEYVVGSLKEIVAGANIDPAAGMAGMDGAADKSWTQIAQDNTKASFADYSLPDFEEMGGQWQQVGEDYSTAGYLGGEWQWDGAPKDQGRQGEGEHGG